MRIELFKANTTDPKRQVWAWRFRARNGQIIAGAETFDNHGNAKRAAKNAVRAVVKGDPKFRVAVRVPSVTFKELWTKDYYIITWTTE